MSMMGEKKSKKYMKSEAKAYAKKLGMKLTPAKKMSGMKKSKKK